VAAPVKPEFLTDPDFVGIVRWIVPKGSLREEDKRCAVKISGTSRLDETRFRHRFLDELEVNPKNGLPARSRRGRHCFVVAFCSIDDAALVIAVCRPGSVVNKY
jgi:hypothetical protein